MHLENMTSIAGIPLNSCAIIVAVVLCWILMRMAARPMMPQGKKVVLQGLSFALLIGAVILHILF